MSYSLPYDPFELLKPTKLIHTENVDLYRGAGEKYECGINSKIRDYDNGDYINVKKSFTCSTENIYYEIDGIPVPFGIGTRRDLVDGTDRLHKNSAYSEPEKYIYTTVLGASLNENQAKYPMLLLEETRVEYMHKSDSEYLDVFKEKLIVTYPTLDDNILKTETSVNVDESNNDFYEGLFNYDINGNGDIPPYSEGLPIYTDDTSNIKKQSKVQIKWIF